MRRADFQDSDDTAGALPAWERALPDTDATARLGAALAVAVEGGGGIWLDGDLGVGKTALVRAFLRARGYQGPVKSPTYAILELYALSSLYCYHFDFYRFNAPEEFQDAGLGEYFRGDALCFVEWPDKAAGYVPEPDLVITLAYAGAGRRAVVFARSSVGQAWLRRLIASAAEQPGR